MHERMWQGHLSYHSMRVLRLRSRVLLFSGALSNPHAVPVLKPRFLVSSRHLHNTRIT